MKKTFRIALAGAVLAGVLAVSAAAAEYTACADHLHALGLFQGTEQGYELDRVPTRAEAAVMLVRLLGAEQDALALEYTAPFADLADWQQPYVQYLYDNGLTTGVSDTAFAPEQNCSAQMYAAFAMRALGYNEAAGDYAYADAAAFAEQIGLFDPTVIDTAVFLRDDIVAASYTALSLPVKGSGELLLDKLVSEGAVDPAAAEPYQDLFSAYAQYREATAGMAERTQYAVRSSMTAALSTGVNLSTEDYTTVDRTSGTAKAEGTLTLAAANMASYTQTYHMDSSDQTGSVLAALLHGYNTVPLVMTESITHTGTRWTFSFAVLPARYNGLLWALSHAGGAYEQQGDAVLSQTVQNGCVAAQALTVDLTQGETTVQVELSSTIESA